MKKKIFVLIIILAASFFVGFKSFELVKKLSTQTKIDLLHINHNFLTEDAASNYITANQLNLDILHYNIELSLFPDEKKLIGDVTITGIMKEKSKVIDLNFYDNLVIDKVELNKNEVKYFCKGTKFSVTSASNIIDTFKLRIVYQGTPKNLGLSSFVFGKINNQSLVYNLSEPNFASTWFPCNDIPTDKALVDIKITSDTDKVSASNGILVSCKTIKNKKTYHWKTLYPISTYLVCIYSSNFKMFTDKFVSSTKDTMPIMYFVLPEHLEKAKTDFEEHPKMLEVFSKLFGEYPFIKEKYGVAEFLWQSGAMEHQTLTGIGSNFINGNKMFNDIYIHELAHHWWGDAISPATWKDIWLNEGFATYSEALYDEYLYGKNALRSSMQEKYRDKFDGTIYNPGDNLFVSKVYNKGAWTLHMLRWEMGDSTFFYLLKNYFEKFKYKNASTEDFKNLAEEYSNKNLNKFFKQWIYEGEGILKLEYVWKIIHKNDDFILDLKILQVQTEYDEYNFPLEIKIEYDDSLSTIYKILNVDKKNFSIQIKLNKPCNWVELDPNKWLLASIKDVTAYE